MVSDNSNANRDERITEAIENELEEWEKDPKDINRSDNGSCAEFAYNVFRRVKDYDDLRVRTESTANPDHSDGDPLAFHVWVYDMENEYRYDAEAPEGVEDWRDLPFFERNPESEI